MARQLAEQAREEGLSLTGPDGLLGGLTKVVLEGALEGEMDAHLKYARHDGRDGGNSRNGYRPRPWSPMSARCRSRCPATGTPRSSRRSWRSGSGGCPGRGHARVP
jgi:transposase-like protein